RPDELPLGLCDHADEPPLEGAAAELLGRGGQHGALHGGEPAVHGGKAREGVVHAASLLGARVHGAHIAVVARGRARGAQVIGTADLDAVAEARIAAVRVTLARGLGAEEDESRARVLLPMRRTAPAWPDRALVRRGVAITPLSPGLATADAKRSPARACGCRKVWRNVPAASKRYGAPPSRGPKSSRGAPMSRRDPVVATALPNCVPREDCGWARSVCRRSPVVVSNR